MRRQREDNVIARRANALLLLDDRKSYQVIAEFLYLDDDTIRRWYKSYRGSSWDALAVDGWKGGQSRMTTDQEAALCRWLDGRFCRSSSEAALSDQNSYPTSHSHETPLQALKPQVISYLGHQRDSLEYISSYLTMSSSPK